MKNAWVFSVVTFAAGFTALAVELPLEFKSIEPSQISDFPGGGGAYGQLRLKTPDALKKQPPAKSKFPLFAQFEAAENMQPMVGRVDESKGDGKGYDELLLDLNRNGDLTDDTPIRLRTIQKGSDEAVEFGPVKMPGTLYGGTPTLYGGVYLANMAMVRSANTSMDRENLFAGQVRVQAGWFLQAKLKLDGTSHLVGIYDANFNNRLGEPPKPSTYRRDDQENWYFTSGDSLLVDADHSGRFTTDPFGAELCAFGPLLYLGATPMRVKLSTDAKSLSLVSWEGPLAEVVLGSKPQQVRTIKVAWKRGTDDWQLIRPAIVDGKIKLPPGEYRLYSCALVGEPSRGNSVMVSAYQNVPKQPFRVEAGKPNLLKCGGPLDVKVTATKRKPQPWEERGLTASASDSDFVLAINANVAGADGELYSSFLSGPKFNTRPAEPTFTVTGAGSKQLANGKLEYG